MSVRRKITFDRNEIRKTIVPLSFNEARRLRGPIYDALIQELYEAGCTKAACNFRRLMDKEREIMRLQNIRDRVSDDRVLLFALFENCKKAEQLSKLKVCEAKGDCFRLLLKCLILLEPHIMRFEWLLREMFAIIADYCETICGYEGSAGEVIAKIRFKYANFLNEKRENLEKAIDLLEKARYLARGQSWQWYTETSIEVTTESLHCAVSKLLSKVLTNFGKELAPTKPQLSVELGDRAILAIAEVGLTCNKYEYLYANIKKAEFLIECPNYKQALDQLKKIEHKLVGETSSPFLKLNCKLLLVLGICYTNLENTSEANLKLRQALQLSQKLGLKPLEAKIYLYLGKMWSEIPTEHSEARQAFAQAKQIFIELNDAKGQKHLIYLLAKLKSNELQPQLKALIKNNNMFVLRRWKYRCEPFWETTVE